MIKKIGLIFFGVLMISLWAANSVFAATGKVKSDGVRIRREASTDSEILTDLYLEDDFEIIEKSGDWYKVKFGEYTGYAHADYITSDEVTETPATPTTTETPEEKPNEEAKPATTNETNPVPEQPTTPPSNSNSKVVNSKEDLKFLPLISSDVKCQVNENTNVSVLESVNGWSYINANANSGWIRSDKLSDVPAATAPEKKNEAENKPTEENQAQTPVATPTVPEPIIKYVSADSLNLRKENNTDSEIVETLTKNASLKILETLDGWYKVEVEGKQGYINSSYVSDTKAEEVSTTSRRMEEQRNANLSAPVAPNGEAIAELAKSFVGYSYVYGGSSPETGFDCSGLVWYVYGQFGYKINRTASAQVNNGVEISRENLQPGDILIFLDYGDYSSIGHSGIYIGNDQFVHASTEETGVIITSLSYGSYPRRLVCGRRIIN